MRKNIDMKTTIADQLTWQDIREIAVEAYRLATVPESKKAYTQEEYYSEILNRLKRRAKEKKD